MRGKDEGRESMGVAQYRDACAGVPFVLNKGTGAFAFLLLLGLVDFIWVVLEQLISDSLYDSVYFRIVLNIDDFNQFLFLCR